MKVFARGLFLSPDMSTPMRRIRPPCCARAAIGHAAVPPSPARKSRRRRQMLICLSHAREPYGGENSTAESLWGLPDRVLHCGMSAPSADGFMAEMGPGRVKTQTVL